MTPRPRAASRAHRKRWNPFRYVDEKIVGKIVGVLAVVMAPATGEHLMAAARDSEHNENMNAALAACAILSQRCDSLTWALGVEKRHRLALEGKVYRGVRPPPSVARRGAENDLQEESLGASLARLGRHPVMPWNWFRKQGG